MVGQRNCIKMTALKLIFLPAICTVLLICSAAEAADSLWSKISKAKESSLYGSGFSFKLFQFLPNPEYHGPESRAPSESPFVPQRDCNNTNGNLTVGSSGIITSPNYPDNYPPGLKCQWTLKSEPGSVIRVTFFDMVTQPWFLFYHDYLAVSDDGDWNKFYRFTGDMNRLAPISIESKANELGVRFVSALDFFNYRGFKMGYVVSRKTAPVSSQPANETASPEQVSQNDPGNGDDPALVNGDGNDVSAICDYVPIELPPESSGEIPLDRIVGGSQAVPHEYPFMVALLMDGENFCGGSLIDELHVLTAAHCTSGAKKIELFFGVHDMNSAEADSRQYQVVEAGDVIQHPKYLADTSSNDISIIRLKERIRTTAFVQPVYLPSAYSMSNTFTGWKLTTMGWGDTNKTFESDQGSITPILKKTTSSVIPNEACRKVYKNLITGNVLCSEGSTTDSPCFGDSGAPLIAKFTRTQNTGDNIPAVITNDGQSHQCFFSKSHRNRSKQEKVKPGAGVTEWFVQLGVLSFGSRTCGSGNPVAFTRVTAYMDFISGALSQDISF